MKFFVIWGGGTWNRDTLVGLDEGWGRTGVREGMERERSHVVRWGGRGLSDVSEEKRGARQGARSQDVWVQKQISERKESISELRNISISETLGGTYIFFLFFFFFWDFATLKHYELSKWWWVVAFIKCLHLKLLLRKIRCKIVILFTR